MDKIYIRAGLNQFRFAIPASAVLKILRNPVVSIVPDAPEGICGIVYDAGTILPVWTVDPGRTGSFPLVILCEKAAYAADRVEGMGPLENAEAEEMTPFRAPCVLLSGEGSERWK